MIMDKTCVAFYEIQQTEKSFANVTKSLLSSECSNSFDLSAGGEWIF